MKKNIGCMERNIRILLGIIILGLGYYYGSYWGLLGIIPILTAIVSWCPITALLGISTCSKCGLKNKKK